MSVRRQRFRQRCIIEPDRASGSVSDPIDNASSIRGGVKTYFFYIHDDRYSVPTFEALDAADDDGARNVAAKRLFASRHYQRIEVFADDELLLWRLER
jgi:hypothetical protein